MCQWQVWKGFQWPARLVAAGMRKITHELALPAAGCAAASMIISIAFAQHVLHGSCAGNAMSHYDAKFERTAAHSVVRGPWSTAESRVGLYVIVAQPCDVRTAPTRARARRQSVQLLQGYTVYFLRK